MKALPDTVRAYLASRLRPDELAHVDRLLAAADASASIERRAAARKAAVKRKAKQAERAERRAWRRGLAELRARIRNNRNSMDLETTTPRDPSKVNEALAGGAGGPPGMIRGHEDRNSTSR